MSNLGSAIIGTLTHALNNIVGFIPNFISGLVILIFGWIVAAIAGFLVRRVLEWVGLSRLLSRVGLGDRQAVRRWPNLLSQVAFWFIFLTFLVPVFNAWQLTSITTLLNQFVRYIPNIFAAVVIGFVGFMIAHIAFGLTKNGAIELGSDAANFWLM